ncbi:HEPN domain-containing protein [Streptomyces sp. NBC_01387]|uniref:HEPN domain-containing protein n=1 Tax=unclassified Streptomyces TaxID=2593676 RepID=UPI002023BF38|nr:MULTISPECIES: HEPN domain-containing protein [unclassified Streptomyces]WSV55698.1 HEPN domain-containing protein [Streptomyces sp. NBC_01014]
MRWEQGRSEIDAMLSKGELQKVAASREQADRLMAQAVRHLETARAAAANDAVGAYQLVYDAARKALSATLENQGLRATSRGGHLAIRDAALAQFEPPLGKILRPFDRMRRRRNGAEYPDRDTPEITAEDVENDLPKAEQIVKLGARVLDRMRPY